MAQSTDKTIRLLKRVWGKARFLGHAFLLVVGIAFVTAAFQNQVRLSWYGTPVGQTSVGQWFHFLTVDMWTPYVEAAISMQHKVEDFQQAEESSHRLTLENAILKLKLEGKEFECKAQEARTVTQKLQSKLEKETGTRVGRSLANISYKIPENLSVAELYTLATHFFGSKDDEKAAALLTHLTGTDTTDVYKNAKNYLMTGVAWYRLDNLDLASFYFDKVLASPEQIEDLKFQAQARLWKGIVAERLGKHTKAQYWVRDLIDHHPQSMEAKWVNGGSPTADAKEANRATASTTEH